MENVTTPRRVVIDTAEIEAICQLHDDLYRNQLITYAYDCISRRLAAATGGHANWFTFARWSSFTVGENLRTDKPSDAFLNLVNRKRLLRSLRTPLTQLNRKTRTWSDAAMPRTLALGNRLVFHEIAHAVVSFLEWCEATGEERSPDEWQDYRSSIVAAPATELFPACDIEWLRNGIESYFLAMSERDPVRQSRLVLRGNVMLAAYEQWRLQPIVALALDPIAKTLVRFADTDMHSDNEGPRAILRRAGTPWAFRHRSAAGQFAMERYQHFMTRHVMAWQGPLNSIGALSFGQGIPYPSDGDGHVGLDDDPNDPTTLILRVFDRSGGQVEGRTAQNWARFSDRMNFIVHLFRAGHDESDLFDAMSERELRIVGLDLSDGNLDRLRARGDRPADDLLAELIHNDGGDPRALVHRLIRDNMPKDRNWYGPGEVPEWVDASQDRLRKGRSFLCEYGAEIGAALFFASLPYSYTAAHGAHVLTRTAELTTGRTSRRLAETGQLLLDLMASDPNGIPLGPGTLGRESVEGVRLFHAAVRRMIDTDPSVIWDAAELGVPINQEDLLGTLVVFTVVVVGALEKLGIDFGEPAMRDARDAYVEYWVAVGALLGIDFDRLRRTDLDRAKPPLNFDELVLIGAAIFRRQGEPSLDGQTLTASLLEATQRAMPYGMKHYPAAAVRGLLGNETADALGVPPAGTGRFVFSGVRAGTRLFWSIGAQQRRELASETTRFLYQYWIDMNEGHFPAWRTAAVPEWGLRPRSDLAAPVDIDLTAAEQKERGPAGSGNRPG